MKSFDFKSYLQKLSFREEAQVLFLQLERTDFGQQFLHHDFAEHMIFVFSLEFFFIYPSKFEILCISEGTIILSIAYYIKFSVAYHLIFKFKHY